jgi:two-component system cell cycle sensor histidine kinase/response regulator CckA
VEQGRLRWSDITPVRHKERDHQMIAKLREKKLYPSHEKEYVAKNGSVVPVLISCGVLSTDENDEMEVVVSITDLRELKKKEAELLQLARAVENAFEGIIITDIDTRIVYANEAFERITGFSKSEVIQQTTNIFKSGKTTREQYDSLWSTLKAGETWKGHFWNKKKDGSEYLEDTTITPIKDSSGTLINYLAVKRDITREQELEQRLIQSQKLEAVGQLTGGVAHDLNNVLQVIHSSAELAIRRRHDSDYIEKKLTDIVTSSKRGAGIIRQLLMFSRGETPTPKPVELNAVIRETGTMLKRLLPENIEIVTEFENRLTLIEVDPVRLSQVLLNLAVNGRDAMPDGGVLTIGTRRTEKNGENFVRLSVSDTGVGMDKITQTKIFEPFFTTKEAGKGTGLGLSTVHEIAEQSHAHLSVESEVGHGTSFHLDFPAVEQRTLDSKDSYEEIHSGVACVKGNVLVCEDDENVRSAICEYLEGAGLKVTPCSNANEAKVAFAACGPEVLITDLIMPGQSGIQLGKELRQIVPGLKILLITGHTEHALVQEAHAAGSFALLQKPFSAASLLEQLRNLECSQDA